jgi:hypothetical protein
MQQVPRQWPPEHESPPVTFDDILRFAMAERPVALIRTASGVGRRHRRARRTVDRSAR